MLRFEIANTVTRSKVVQLLIQILKLFHRCELVKVYKSLNDISLIQYDCQSRATIQVKNCAVA